MQSTADTAHAAVQAAPVVPGWLPDWLQGVWGVLAAYPLVLAAVIVAVGLVLALGARQALRFWGRRISARTSTRLDEQLFRLLGNIGATTVVYLSLIAAVQVLPIGAGATSVVARLLVSLLILHIMRAALGGAHLALLAVSEMRGRFPIVEQRTIPLFDIMFTVLIIGIATYALLQVWRIDATAWLASAGVIGIAVGFAAKDSLANLFAGFFIIADAPYKMGDYVVLDTGERGEITRVGIRSTRMLTRDDVEIIIPNSVMANTKVINESGGVSPQFRIRVKVGVAYGADVDAVVALLEETARAHDAVVREPAPRVRMRGFGDSSLDFELLCWVGHPSERGLVTHHLYMNIYKALGAAGIEIPFPQRDVWLRAVPAALARENADGDVALDPAQDEDDGARADDALPVDDATSPRGG